MKYERIIFHLDVNSAYLSWEAVHRIKKGEKNDLRKIPAVIGGDREERHGVVLAKSVPAKKYGIVTGEPVSTALKKCPALLVVPPSHAVYSLYSSRLRKLLQQYFPLMEQTSIDEFYLDYTGLERLWGSWSDFVFRLKEKIKQELLFTVNIGVSCNKLLAKMASDMEKPDKVHTLFPEEIAEKMWPLSVGELFMVGRATEKALRQAGILTIGQLAKLPKEILMSKLKKQGLLIWQYANGLDERPVAEEEEIKSISQELTLPVDINKREEAYAVLTELTEKVAYRLRQEKKFASVIMVNLRDYKFNNCSRQKKIAYPTAGAFEILQTAKALFDDLWNNQPIRLLGVGVKNLTSEWTEQLGLFEEKKAPSELDKVLDEVRLRYGEKSLMKGDLFIKKNYYRQKRQY